MPELKKTEIPGELLSTFLEELELGMRELNHSLRSPLSVMLGIIEDLESGCSLSKEDISDGRKSLQKASKLLNTLALTTAKNFDTLSIESFDDTLENIFRCTVSNSINPKTLTRLRLDYLLPLFCILADSVDLLESFAQERFLHCLESGEDSSVVILLSTSATENIDCCSSSQESLPDLDLTMTNRAALNLYLRICNAKLVRSAENALGIHITITDE